MKCLFYRHFVAHQVISTVMAHPSFSSVSSAYSINIFLNYTTIRQLTYLILYRVQFFVDILGSGHKSTQAVV